MEKLTSLTIFFPALHDSRTLPGLVRTAYEVGVPIASSLEVMVIDDGSTDETPEVLRKLTAQYPTLRVISHRKNLGYGSTLRDGFNRATKEFVFYTDGDGQYDVRELPRLVRLMSNNADFVNGRKMARLDPMYRIIVGNLYRATVRWLFRLPVDDVDCDFRLIRRSFLRKLQLRCTSGAICVELVKKAQRAGGIFRQVSVHHYLRRYGRSQFFRVDRILRTLGELIVLWIELVVGRLFSRR